MRGLFVRHGIIASLAYPGELGGGFRRRLPAMPILTDDDGTFLVDDNGF